MIKNKFYNNQYCQELTMYLFNILGIKIKILPRHFNIRYIIYKTTKTLSKNLAVSFYLNSYLKKALYKIENEADTIENSLSDKKYIWSMWWQKDIPEIIQMCLDSIKSFYPNLIIITSENYMDYIEIPEYMIEKFKKGIIPPPHFSDYIRVNLLDKYGGVWIDSSCYLVNPIPKYILKQDFFIFKNFKNQGFSNYFIYTTKNNRLIKLIKLCLEAYWEKENLVLNYFFFYDIFQKLTEIDKECNLIYSKILTDLWERTKLITFFSEKTHYNEDLWNYLKQTGFLYKIARKLDNVNDEDGFVRHLLNKWKMKN